MDSITNPTIVKINNRNYRCLHPTNFNKQRSKLTPKKRIVMDEYEDEEVYIEDFAITEPTNLDEKLSVNEEDNNLQEEDTEENHLLESKIQNLLKDKDLKVYLDNGRFACSIHVPSSLRGYLIGKNCATIKEIEAKTKTQIDFPEMHRKDDPFYILGQDENAVLLAYLRISELLQAKRDTTNLTHFLAIKCDNEEIRSSYEKFKQILQSKYLPQGYSEKVFIGKGKLHLTISIFVLLDNLERNKMVSFMNKNLKRVIDEFIKQQNLSDRKKKLKFSITGLDYMNDDPTEVKVLYAKVSENAQLIQKLCDKINVASNFGFTSDFRPEVKLHMTLLNTRYIPYSHKKENKQYKSFDATNILKELKDFHFGTVDLNEISLLISGTFDEKTEGYKSSHSIKF